MCLILSHSLLARQANVSHLRQKKGKLTAFEGKLTAFTGKLIGFEGKCLTPESASNSGS